MSASNEAFKAQQEEKGKLTKERNERCFPVADKVFELIAAKHPTFDGSDQDKVFKEYESTVSEALTVMRDAGLSVEEANYVIRLCTVRMELVKATVEKSLEINKGELLKKVFGKQLDKLTLTEMDEKLKETKE